MGQVWIIRAGGRGEREQFALNNDCVVIDWENLPDLRGMRIEKIQTFYNKPGANQRKNPHSYHQPYKFANNVEEGDLVLLPSKSDTSYVAVGEITGDYQYHVDGIEGTKHRRPVRWLDKELQKTTLPADIRNSLSGQLTVFTVQRENAETRIRAVLGKSAPPATTTVAETETEEPQDLYATAHDDIREHISMVFQGYEMQELVAAILEAMGYRCLVPPEGADGGVDILAAGGGDLGFHQPHLCVQVKNTREKTGDRELRDLQGTMRNQNARKGIFMSWSGFKNKKKLEQSYFFDILLWNSDDVIGLIYKHYEKLSDDIKGRLRLKQIWVIAPDSD